MKRFSIIAFSLLYIYTCLLEPIQAIYESQAGVFDWHHAWIGKPRWTTEYQHGSLSHIIISTEKNVLASLDALTGAIEWRQWLEKDIQATQLTEEGVITVSNNNHTLVQYWDTKTGKLEWQRVLASDKSNNNSNGNNEKAVNTILSANQQAIIVQNNVKVYRLSVLTGDVEWEYALSVPSLMLHQVKDIVYAIGRVDSAYHVLGLDQATGQLVQPSLRLAFQTDSNSLYPSMVVVDGSMIWIEKDALKWNVLGTKKIYQISLKSLIGSSASFTGVAVDDSSFQLATTTQGTDMNGLFFLHANVLAKEDELATATCTVTLSDDKKTIKLAKDLGVQKSFGAISKSNLDITRVTRDLTTSSLVIDAIDTQQLTHRQVAVPLATQLAGDIVTSLVVSEPSKVLLSTDSGSIYMYDKTKNTVLWSREEALAHTTATEFLDLPEKQLWTEVDEEEANPLDQSHHKHHQHGHSPVTRYIRRLAAHAVALRKLPSWIVHHFIDMSKPMSTLSFTKDDVTVLQAQACHDQQQEMENEKDQSLYRDSFGMRKLLISVTSTGKVIAQDSARHGKIIWTRYMPGVTFDQVYVVRTAAVKLPPVIVVIGTSNEGATTHLYRLNGLTGQDYHPTSSDTEVQEAFDAQLVTETTVSKVMMLPLEEPDEHTHLLALYDQGTTRVYIYPDTNAARLVAQPFWSRFYFKHQVKGSLKGYQVVEGYRHSLTAQPVWNMALPQGEQLLTTNAHHHGQQQQQVQAASIGRVLGNRNVLYKYLNPNIFTVLSGDAEQQTLTVRVMDAVKGTILYETVHSHVPASSFASVHVVQTENWIVYHFWSNNGKDTGYQVAVLELYEGALENQRVPSTNFSSFDPLQPSIQSVAFAFPYAVQAMGMTTTRFGVSTRDILFALPSHQILTVNKRLLDPRRPTHPPTKEDQEEQLIPYAPIPEERKMFLTYDLEIIGIQHIISAPALLESTSLIYAYGLDTYFTRDSPSRQFDVLSEDFSKSQLLLTIVALVVGILVAGPIVRRKQVNALWQ